MADPQSPSADIVVWGDNEARIKTIQGWFGSGGENLLKPGRILVGEGMLLKQCRKKMKPRQFFLFNDMIMFANVVVPRKRYNQQRILKLSELSVEPSRGDEKAMQILAPGRSFLVVTASLEEAREWIFHIKMCIQNLPEKEKVTSKPPAAALWIPDSSAGACMVCNTSKFTTFNRRHHCRNCGRVTCGPCSAKKYILPAISSKPSRVCDVCFEKLSKVTDDTTPDNHSTKSSASQQRAELLASQQQQLQQQQQQATRGPETQQRDYESEEETTTASSLPRVEIEKDSDSDGDEDPTQALDALNLDPQSSKMYSENKRSSLFFTKEDNTTESLGDKT